MISSSTDITAKTCFCRYAILENDFSFYILYDKQQVKKMSSLPFSGSAQQRKPFSKQERDPPSEQQTQLAAEKTESKAQHLLK